MRTSTRLAAFAVAVLAVLGGGAALGAAAGPAPLPPPPAHPAHEEQPMSATPSAPAGEHASHTAGDTGYRVVTEDDVIPAGLRQTLAFEVRGPGGTTVVAFEPRHERLMHLIVVSQDLVTYAHLHPELGADGRWTVELPPLTAGGYRVIADTAPAGGPDLVIPFQLLVPGATAGTPLPEPGDTTTVDDLTVSLDLRRADDGIAVALTVRRADALVEPDPYLGARGHLVAIAADDLAYLHVHPEGNAPGGPVSFAMAAPRPGRYRLFFDFSVGGRFRTAAFTVDLTADGLEVGAGEGTASSADHRHAVGEEHR